MPGGTVKKYFQEKGFGFIKPDDGGNDLFAPKRTFIGEEANIVEGARVNYESEMEERTGKFKASWWSITNAGDAAATAGSAGLLGGLGATTNIGMDPATAASLSALAANQLLGLGGLGGMPGLAGYGAASTMGLDNRFSPYGGAAGSTGLPQTLGAFGMAMPDLSAATAPAAALTTMPGAGLPPGWEQVTDPSSGKAYYCNRSTGETSWTPPAAAAAVPATDGASAPAAGAPAAAPAAAGALPAGWEQAADPASGKTYYFNRSTGQTAWTPPQA